VRGQLQKANKKREEGEVRRTGADEKDLGKIDGDVEAAREGSKVNYQ